jgi:hypothetical protein
MGGVVLVSAPTVFRDGLVLLLARWGCAKLDASGRAGAVAKAMRLGLIE